MRVPLAITVWLTNSWVRVLLEFSTRWVLTSIPSARGGPSLGHSQQGLLQTARFPSQKGGFEDLSTPRDSGSIKRMDLPTAPKLSVPHHEPMSASGTTQDSYIDVNKDVCPTALLFFCSEEFEPCRKSYDLVPSDSAGELWNTALPPGLGSMCGRDCSSPCKAGTQGRKRADPLQSHLRDPPPLPLALEVKAASDLWTSRITLCFLRVAKPQ